MTKKTKTAGKTAKSAIQNYSYANVYAIQTCPLANDEDGVEVTKFITKDSSISDTVWPCRAKWFDTPEEALAKLITLKLPREKCNDGIIYPRVVRVELKCDITSANDELYEALLKKSLSDHLARANCNGAQINKVFLHCGSLFIKKRLCYE